MYSLNKTDNDSPKDHHHLQAYTGIGYPTRHLALKQLLATREWWTHLEARHVVLHPSLDFVRIDAATMVNIHCVQQIERDIVRDCEPKLGHSCDHLRLG